MDILRRDVLTRKNASRVYKDGVMLRFQLWTHYRPLGGKVEKTFQSRNQGAASQDFNCIHSGVRIAVRLSELYAIEAFDHYIVMQKIRMAKIAKQGNSREFRKFFRRDRPFLDLIPEEDLYGFPELSTSEITRLRRAIYNIARSVEHVHSYMEEHGTYTPYIQDSRFLVYDKNPDPDVFTTAPTIDIETFFATCSVEEHMHIVATMNFVLPYYFGGLDGTYWSLLKATLYDRLLNLNHFVANREREASAMVQIVSNSLWDYGQPQVVELLDKVSRFGWEGGFNKSRYITGRGRTCVGTVEEPTDRETLVPDVSILGWVGWCKELREAQDT
ncbi:hypothetical protein BJ508DRAFT_301327 [Ascobolus immersus RN42]|uniref:Uncharacterized protein n=1 Tax=Ascobolus immersus RN42 TaxID=1160509 RepID=A0A3N4IMV8_ASCIM|nr:hypothetical protein BJ508DRAFT_301327 [Ascobolus immersus RN42]